MRLIVLGIETSCDETGVALLIDGRIASDRTTTQLFHEEYGGIIPELASRTHIQLLTPALEGCLEDARLRLEEITLVAATYGPGLVGALLVGISHAKGLASSLNIPFLGINHLESHLWAAELTHGSLPLPFLCLIISGGHTLMLEVHGLGDYRRLGGTHDDAAGELLDKVGRMMGYSFPAGNAIDQDALDYNGKPVQFPRAKVKGYDFGFSFSGLKTAVLYYLYDRFTPSHSSAPGNRMGIKGVGFFNLPDDDRQAISAGIMEAVSDMLIKGLIKAWNSRYRALVITGGVASSRFLRSRFAEFASDKKIPLITPPPEHCTDNGAMVAYAAYLRLQEGYTSPLNLPVDPAADLFKKDETCLSIQR